MERINKLLDMLESAPNDCFLLHALGLECIKLGEIVKGIQYFEKVISTDPNYVGTYYHLAKACEKTGDIPNAIFWYQKGIAIAELLKDQHAKNELLMALEDMEE